VCEIHKGREMESQQVDKILLAILKDLPYFSKLGTCLCIRLSDYAAQMCGCRSTRQMNDNQVEDIDEQYHYLLDILDYHIKEAINYISVPHCYKDNILSSTEDEIEDLIIEVLFSMVVMDYKNIFAEYFFAK